MADSPQDRSLSEDADTQIVQNATDDLSKQRALPQFSLIATVGFMTICAVHASLGHKTGWLATAGLMVMALGMFLKQGPLALAGFITACMSGGSSTLGSSIPDLGRGTVSSAIWIAWVLGLALMNCLIWIPKNSDQEITSDFPWKESSLRRDKGD